MPAAELDDWYRACGCGSETMSDAEEDMAAIRRHWLEGKAEDGFQYWPHRSASDDIRTLFATLSRARLAAIEEGWNAAIKALRDNRSERYDNKYPDIRATWAADYLSAIAAPSDAPTDEGGR